MLLLFFFLRKEAESHSYQLEKKGSHEGSKCTDVTPVILAQRDGTMHKHTSPVGLIRLRQRFIKGCVGGLRGSNCVCGCLTAFCHTAASLLPTLGLR